ncbi:putative nucleotidyltransferase, Ribonuclease H [Helianthus annuus]|nr:putative nucleotidyltransferase, Ribonuclease H [Helianthus annuus]KAJ0574807.1 putative nucleotidyltransferase, Ribonuclease H [Helianthus annuus]KAJ0739138.1 putative nucleotidyltransferase, Ribonuclease H [Helianthus annuus]
MESWKEDIETLKLQEAKREKNHGGGMRFDDGEPGYSNSNRRPYHKIDFPTFSGGDPRGWVVKAEKYFRFYDTSDDDKVDVAAMHLEGDALDLYSWVSAEQEITYWEELVSTLQKHFGPPEFQNPDEYLCSIKQTGSVNEYRQEFARRSSRVSQWPDHCLLGVFLNELKDELKSDVRIHKPRSVYKAVSLALEYESKLNHSKTDRRSTWSSQVKSESKPTITTTVPATTKSKPPIRISETEKQTRFLKGECFRCGDKYGPGHRCKAGTLKLLEAEEDPDDQGNAETNSEENQGDAAEISLHAIFGRPHPTTMKVHGKLNSTEVLILVDGGSTHNFISDVLVNELKMATQPVAPFGVQIGNGDVIRCGQICKNLSVQVNDLQIVQDFYPFSIGGADLVLGIQWLATLNTVQANWKELFMVFTIDGKRYKLQGISSGPQKSSSFQHLAIEPDTEIPIPPPLQPLINQYQTVFDEPKHLPPNRTQVHSIPLLPNSVPPNIRPYRYPHSQKTEIEKQVDQLLAVGFIQPSNSPFSSPVLLVKKKDSSWRMCVDYGP